MSQYFQKIRNQVMWDRLIAVVEEQARTMMRVAFSPVVREAGDLSAGIFSTTGQLLAQAVTGTPGHINSMARSVKHFMGEFPPEMMQPGDAFITNDPWKGTGHLFDLTVVTPAFDGDRLVALHACTAHVADIGGNGPDIGSRDVLAEGLFIPIMQLCSRGKVDSRLINLMRANSREPDRLEGDVYALMASNLAGAERLKRMLEEYRIRDLDALSTHILDASDRSMREAIGRWPQGSYTNSMRIDGIDEPIDFVATLKIESDMIRIDFSGTSPVSRYGINCPLCYSDAYSSFGVKCLVAPRLANNAAVLSRISVTAPENCIVNALPPAPVTGRSMIGQVLPDVVFGCFDQAMPGEVPAEGTGGSSTLRLGAGPGIGGVTTGKFTAFILQSFQNGGMGAHPRLDGLSATAYPSGVKSIAIEVTEALTPLVVWKKELRTDSGGAGRRRGGLGQVLEIGSREPAPFAIFARFQRVEYPARGRRGGMDGAAGTVNLKSGAPIKRNGTQLVPPGDRLIIELAGGGGLGSPLERPADLVLDDVKNGLVSRDRARDVYRVEVRDDLSIDEEATAKRRCATALATATPAGRCVAGDAGNENERP
jgi:N-methylhydantoinase B